MFFDSHCHLTDPKLARDRAEVLRRASIEKVTGMVSIAVDLEDSAAILDFADGRAIWATAGVHPQNALSWAPESESRLRALATRPHVVAIGEIGLDYLYDETHPKYPGATRPVQREVFEAQLQIAADLNLPIVIHNREADEDLLAMVTAWADRLPRKGVFHCFGSGPDVARRVLDLGFFLGFTGTVTFKNAEDVRNNVNLCPLDQMLIETDAPYLAPAPYRGKTNEPSYVPLVASQIAIIKNLSDAEVGQLTTANAHRLFGIQS